MACCFLFLVVRFQSRNGLRCFLFSDYKVEAVCGLRFLFLCLFLFSRFQSRNGLLLFYFLFFRLQSRNGLRCLLFLLIPKSNWFAVLLLFPAHPDESTESYAPAIVVAGFDLLTHGPEAASVSARPLLIVGLAVFLPGLGWSLLRRLRRGKSADPATGA